jgi:hypothetical protein
MTESWKCKIKERSWNGNTKFAKLPITNYMIISFARPMFKWHGCQLAGEVCATKVNSFDKT